ncbi:DUF2089 domain-containing protein [Oceanirhabdus sp. W0125-5]|uniref:DUF2089 domain-containing protein n=1 Tax=Oceanirhabdus sp. W0125-5 TaxID=2999116 RepID=UPI0022F33921|nr:DUF2089 domain-containing protein [Oceanirhabdus sp. W0125-5]WBW95161.1 DUF2089 domain-containing protein [Oceanirhabdus sp. W0125-5]
MGVQIIHKCPVCNRQLTVRRMKCNECNTVIENEFIFDKFMTMNKEELKFIEVFLKCRGSIKDVEKVLGLSYPTVRSKLDKIAKKIEDKDLKSKKKESSDDSKDELKILKELEDGNIDFDTALREIKKMGEI